MSDPESYNSIYKEFSELLGEEAVKRIWDKYHGQTVNFPQHLYSRTFARQYIKENDGKLHPRKMAHFLNLTERRVRQIIKEVREEEDDTDEDTE